MRTKLWRSWFTICRSDKYAVLLEYVLFVVALVHIIYFILPSHTGLNQIECATLSAKKEERNGKEKKTTERRRKTQKKSDTIKLKKKINNKQTYM